MRIAVKLRKKFDVSFSNFIPSGGKDLPSEDFPPPEGIRMPISSIPKIASLAIACHKVPHCLFCTSFSLLLITSEIVFSCQDVLELAEDIDGGGEGKGTANTCEGSIDEGLVGNGGDGIEATTCNGISLDGSVTRGGCTVENIGRGSDIEEDVIVGTAEGEVSTGSCVAGGGMIPTSN